MNIPDRRNCLRKGRKKMDDVKAVTIRWYWILMGESEVNSQICLNNSLIKDNLTIMNEFLFFFFFWGLPWLLSGKIICLPMQETWVRSLGHKGPLEEGMATIPVFLLGEYHGQRSLAGYSPWGCKRIWHEQLNNNNVLLLLFIFRFISFHF